MRTLADLKPGQKAVVKNITGTGPLKRRFNDMGITKGTEIAFIRVAPLGDPMEISLKGYNMALRKKDACDIIVE